MIWSKNYLIIGLKAVIWLCLGVILFSPLYINSNLFFPFIVTKTIAFNIAVEVMFVAFLLLALKSPDYKIKPNLAVGLFLLYIVWTTISSWLGNDFYRSFWSNNERSEGILLLIHLLLFLFVITNFFRRLKDWLNLFDVFFAAGLLVSLVALGQFFNLSWIFASSGGQRLAGTIGNAGYMAGYLVFCIFFGLLLFFQRKNIYLKIYYGAVILLEIFITLYTDTRGGILALFITGALFILYLLFFYFNNKKLKLVGVGVIVLAILLPSLVFIFKDSSVVKGNHILTRVASISAESTTAENRLLTWASAWQGFKERPLTGWGYENFYQPFDKYFNPIIYRHAGSVVWFDRAHDIIFDRLIIGGLPGLILYLVLLFAPVIYLWIYYAKKDGDKNRYFLPTIFTLIIVAYFIQNLFIFEALVIYIPLFLVIGFISRYGPTYDWSFIDRPLFKGIVFTVCLIALPIALYSFNIKPLQANIEFTKLISNPNLSFDVRVSGFERIMSEPGLGRQEYRRQIFSFFDNLISQITAGKATDIDQATVIRFAGILDRELNLQIQENPNNVSYYLILMRFYNITRNLGMERLDKNFDLFNKAIVLSPNRPQLYYEIGYTNLYLGDYNERTGHDPEAFKYYDQSVANFEQALALNDTNFESYRQLANALIFDKNKNERLDELIKILDDRKISYSKTSFFNQIINTSLPAKNYLAAEKYAQLLIEMDPENPLYYSRLAYAYIKESKTKELAQVMNKVKGLWPDHYAEFEKFVSDVKSGKQ